MRAEFVVFSDLHVHEYKQYSEDTGHYFSIHGDLVEGINSRLLDCFHAFYDVIDYAIDHNIGNILFCGDLIHSKKNITKDVINVLIKAFWYAKQNNVRIIAIPGNHDQSNKDGTNHSFLAFDDFDNVQSANSLMSLIYDQENKDSAVAVYTAPYTEDKQNLISRINCPLNPSNKDSTIKILLAHCGIQGAKVGSDYVMIKDHDIGLDDIDLTKYDACFFGHYHEHQRVSSNAWIVGATLEHNWSDRDGKRGFLHVIIEKEDGVSDVKVIHIPTDRKIPRFKLLDNFEGLVDVKSWDFIRYQSSEELTQDVIDSITGMFAIAIGEIPKYIEILPPKKEENSNTFVMSEKATSAESVLEDWLIHNSSDLDQPKLLAMGRDLLAEARNKLL